MTLVSGLLHMVFSGEIKRISMRKHSSVKRLWHSGMCHTLYFLPLLIMGGRLAAKIILNIWNLIEPGGHTQSFQQTIS